MKWDTKWFQFSFKKAKSTARVVRFWSVDSTWDSMTAVLYFLFVGLKSWVILGGWRSSIFSQFFLSSIKSLSIRSFFQSKESDVSRGLLFTVTFIFGPIFIGSRLMQWDRSILVGTKIQVGFVGDLIFPLRDDVMMNDDYEMIVKIMWY